MKKLILVLIITLLCATTYSQTPLNLNNLVNVSLPFGALTISQNQAASLVQGIFHNDLGAKISTEYGYPYVYQIGDIVFKLHTINRPLKPGLLQSLVVGKAKVLTASSGWTHYLTRVNGKQILITKYSGAVSEYSFNCFNNANNIGFDGTVIYNKADEAQAQLVLNTILASIKFAGE